MKIEKEERRMNHAAFFEKYEYVVTN